MSSLSDKLKAVIEGQGATYLRTININDLNQQVGKTDLKGGVVLGVYSNLPEAENLTYATGNNVLVNETVEVHYLQLSPIDATGDETQVILDTVRPYADGLFDLMNKEANTYQQYIDGYQLESLESVKFLNEVLTGFKIIFTFPYYRTAFTCA